MKFLKTLYPTFFVLALVVFYSCKDKKPEEKDIVKKPEQLEDRVRRNLQDLLTYAADNDGKVNDSVILSDAKGMSSVYEKRGYNPLWSSNGSWLSKGDAIFQFIGRSKNYGLFPSDYHYSSLMAIHSQIEKDTIAQKDAALWSRADVMLTNAVLMISKDIKRGRLPYDSLTLKKDTVIAGDLYLGVLDQIIQSKNIDSALQELEPKLAGYQDLKAGIPGFLDSAVFGRYTYLTYPVIDSASFYASLQQRLLEVHAIDSSYTTGDTASLRKALAAYQSSKKIKPSGKINEATVNSLNDTDWEKFKRIALSLDKYKIMPDTLPPVYVWVNLPSFRLKVIDSDTIALESRVIVGAAKTRTPELSSEISNFITFPQWTVPYSIVFKEMLPQIQKNIKYLEKQNLMVVDRYDSVIDPEKINWSKLSKNKFPYQLKQRQGDDNSLGVLKFNFRNPYSVYLHDTNARWLFSKSSRALSHGCVRVQRWRDLAHFLVRNDTIRYSVDTLANWIARQEKHVVSGFKKAPIFIRYYTCEGVNGKVNFYDDIYAEDKILAEKYFSKNIN
ncbi:MAG: L,D-transpeptidase family protein [Flavitalea sp.]